MVSSAAIALALAGCGKSKGDGDRQSRDDSPSESPKIEPVPPAAMPDARSIEFPLAREILDTRVDGESADGPEVVFTISPATSPDKQGAFSLRIAWREFATKEDALKTFASKVQPVYGIWFPTTKHSGRIANGSGLVDGTGMVYSTFLVSPPDGDNTYALVSMQQVDGPVGDISQAFRELYPKTMDLALKVAEATVVE